MNPKEIYSDFTSKDKVITLLSDLSVVENIFNEESSIEKIQTLGKDVYLVFTTSGQYIIKVSGKGSKSSYDVYEYKTNITQFH